MALKTFAVVGLAGLILAGCEQGPKQTIGTLAGAAGGAAIGSQIGSGSGRHVAIALGTLAGAMLGGEIGRQLDERDQLLYSQAYEDAKTAPIGETIIWSNPESGNKGAITPVRDGTTGSGKYCREFQQTVIIAGEPQQAYGVACRQPDGTWQIVQ
ncbi:MULTISPECIES: RT0821/Lpp0805 family surface protein [Limibacillus]|jgi:surface antigen|uniref:17 kDa surface antigen n=1 Tax=Limibacillus halophilus TaxID=1579333 RepID=A0A839SVW9_9PROT|nr:RT0821/Lpp0805 family surface protein [Limibacillus halophilus]MBB3065093.1 surface antigen [Limibacillus halophilus]